MNGLNNTAVRSLIVLAGLLLLMEAGWSAGKAKETNTGGVNVRLPDGLYMTTATMDAEKLGSITVFKQFLLVEDGKLKDPIRLARKSLGVKKFTAKYVAGKSFQVFSGQSGLGILDQLTSSEKLSISSTPACDHLEDVWFVGSYKGQPIPLALPIYKRFPLPVIEEVRAIAGPTAYHTSQTGFNDVVSKNDILRIAESAKSGIEPLLIRKYERDARKLLKMNVEVSIRNGKVNTLTGFDYEGSGKISYFVIYSFRIDYSTENPLRPLSREKSNALTRMGEAVFVVRSDNAYELVDISEEGVFAAFEFGGLIDVDQDGRQEIILRRGLSGKPAGKGYDPESFCGGGWQYEIMRRMDDGTAWRKIYSSPPTDGR